MSMRTKTPSSRTGTESTIVLDPEEFEASRLGSGARSAGGERSELDERAQRAGGRAQRGAGGTGGARAGGRREVGEGVRASRGASAGRRWRNAARRGGGGPPGRAGPRAGR